jgi:UDP-N-acetyl-D-mannosaminuronic acid transferase (WecB/TagA/CpsF family)
VLFLAEFYLADGTDLAAVADRAQSCAEQAARTGATVSFVEAIFVAQDENCFAVYFAGSAEEVTAAAAMAGLVLDRVTPAVRVSSVRRS